MSRPPVPEVRYRDEFEKMLSEGIDFETITANKFYTRVGAGRFSRASDFLEDFKAEERTKRQYEEQLPEKPRWMLDFITQTQEAVAIAADTQWFAIADAMKKHLDTLEADAKVNERHLSAELSSKTIESSDRLAELKRVESDNDAIQKALAQTQTAARQHSNRCIELETDMRSLKEMLNVQNNEVTDLRHKLEDASRGKALAESQLATAEKAERKLEDSISEATHEIENLKADKDSLIQSNQKLHDNLERIHKDDDLLRKDIGQLERERVKLETENHSLEVRHSEHKARIESLEDSLDAARKTTEDKQEDLGIAQEKRVRAEAENGTLKERLEEKAGEIRDLGDQNQRLHNQVGKLERELSLLAIKEPAAEEKKKPGRPAKK